VELIRAVVVNQASARAVKSGDIAVRSQRTWTDTLRTDEYVVLPATEVSVRMSVLTFFRNKTNFGRIEAPQRLA